MRPLLRLLASDLLMLGTAALFVWLLRLVGVWLSPWLAIALAFLVQLVCVAIDEFGRPGGDFISYKFRQGLVELRKVLDDED